MCINYICAVHHVSVALGVKRITGKARDSKGQIARTLPGYKRKRQNQEEAPPCAGKKGMFLEGGGTEKRWGGPDLDRAFCGIS